MERQPINVDSTVATTLDLDAPASNEEQPFVNKAGFGDRVLTQVVRPEKRESEEEK